MFHYYNILIKFYLDKILDYRKPKTSPIANDNIVLYFNLQYITYVCLYKNFHVENEKIRNKKATL